MLRTKLPLALSLLLAPAATAQSLTFSIDRPVRAVAAEGDVVLSSVGSGLVSVWTPGFGWTDIAGPTTAGRGVSADGTAILAGDEVTGGFLWERDHGWSNIAGPGLRVPLYLSSDGNRVVGRDDLISNGRQTYLWDRATDAVTTLRRPTGGISVFAESLDADGDVIVGSVFAGGATRATIWDETGQPTSIDTFASGVQSAAYGVSADGQWVVGTRYIGGIAFPFRWSAHTGVEVLPTVGAPSPLVLHSPDFVSDDGSVTAGEYFNSIVPFGFELTAYISFDGGPTVRFRDALLERGGPDLGPSVVIRGMSADGERFVVEAGDFSYWIDLDAVVSTSVCGPAVVNSTGASATVVALGSDEAADRVLELRGSSLPPNQTVLPIVSNVEAFFPMAGGLAGNLCLGGTIGRFPLRFADPAGQLDLAIDIAALPAGLGTVSAMAGEDWYFQLWFRDGFSSNFSDAARVSFR